MNAIRTLALAAVVAVAGISGTASAQSAAERYENYSGAVVVYERCNGMRFNQSDMLALNNRIVELVGEQISAGTRLTGIQRAKRYWAARYATESCRGTRLSGMLEIFSTELASAVGR